MMRNKKNLAASNLNYMPVKYFKRFTSKNFEN